MTKEQRYPVVVGLDIGGTKTHSQVALASTGRVLVDEVRASDGWSAAPAEHATAWVQGLVTEMIGRADALRPVARLVAIAVGAQGCEEREQCDRLRAMLATTWGVATVVVNDAELLVPASDLRSGVGVVVGTGAIAVATGRDGSLVRAGGWGWILSDDGSASALVREGARAVLARADRGEAPDQLGALLMASVGTGSVAELAHALSWGTGPERWGTHAPAVVEAADAGSLDAIAVLEAGVRAVASLVTTLASRGADTADVVVGGGVAAAVHRIFAGVRDEVLRALPGTRVRLLTGPPVHGAVQLARRAAGVET